MRVVSVNVGLPRDVRWRGRPVRTGIFKEPVEGRVRVGPLNVEGDRQADPRVHGGADKAVYAYPAEHYPFWAEQYPDLELPWGVFGENLTTQGLDESRVRIGDRFRAGTTELVVTQPRLPCFKLELRLGREGAIRRFLESDRPGIYFKVAEPGDVAAGDPVDLVEADPRALSVRDTARLYAGRADDARLLAVGAEHPHLPESWRERFRARLA